MISQKLNIGLERFTTFGDLLKFLRRRAGLTQRELSIAVGYSHAQISRLELNQRLPDLATITARFIPVLDIGDEPEAAHRLLDLAASMRREDAPASGVAPYKGLQYFDEADADLFFGREALVEKLLNRIIGSLNPTRGKATETPPRILAIVGASGSGKSSILRAGLIPMLRWNPVSANWSIYSITPTAHPLHALAGALTSESDSFAASASLADDMIVERRTLNLFSQRHFQEQLRAQQSQTSGKRHALAGADLQPHILLAVDQFEELFTICRDEVERQAFIDNLVLAATQPDGRVYVAFTLRADFYAQCAPYTELRQVLASQQEYIGPMNSAELRRAIEEPTLRGGWILEPGLVDLLLKDLGAEGPHLSEPGALPLMSHALLETWQRRRGRTLTISGYLASGGVRDAIAETAEVVYHDELDVHQQVIARNIFLRLTEIGDDDITPETRRRASIDELTTRPEDAAAVREVLTHLADARLIITDQGVAEVAHEALIREWPTLRGWLQESRDGLRLHRHLTLAAEGWISQDRDPGELYRGARLAQALEWVQDHPVELNAQEREFLDASRRLAERELAERETQRQHELEAARTLAETQSQAAVQLRRRATYLAVAFVLALGMAGVAVFFGMQARQSAIQAQIAYRLSTARELAASAISSLEIDPERGILLALQAISTTQTGNGSVLPEAEEALHRALLASHVHLVLSGHQDGVLSADYSPDGQQIATIGQDGTAKIWNAETGAEIMSIPGTTEPGDALGTQRLAYSPDGTQLVTGDREEVKLWDAATGVEIATFAGHTGEVWAVAFNPDGSRIASAGVDGTARIWDIAKRELLFTLTGHTEAIEGLAFSPDGTLLATASDDSTLKIWDASSGKLRLDLTNFNSPVYSIDFSSDGQFMATASDESVKVWGVDSGSEVLTIPVGVGDVAFSPDGQRLVGVTGSVAKVWDVLTGQEQLTLAGHADWVTSLDFSPDGRRLVTTSLDQTSRVWSITPDEEALTLVANGDGVAYSPDGTHLATSGKEGIARLWDRQSGEELATLTGHDAKLFAVAFSPDGEKLATASLDETARIWNLRSGETVLTLDGHSNAIRDVAFSQDGRWIATASFDETAKVWDAITGKPVATLIGHNGLVTGVAFSPDGSLLATSSTDATARIWSMPAGELLFTLTGHTDAIPDVAFSPDGTRLVTGSRDTTARVWDTGTGKELLTLAGHHADIWSVAVSPDGRLIGTASGDNTAKLWDASTGQLLLTLPGGLSGATGVAFNPQDGGAELTVASAEGTIRVYLLRLPDLLELANARATRRLTSAECQQYLHLEACPIE